MLFSRFAALGVFWTQELAGYRTANPAGKVRSLVSKRMLSVGGATGESKPQTYLIKCGSLFHHIKKSKLHAYFKIWKHVIALLSKMILLKLITVELEVAEATNSLRLRMLRLCPLFVETAVAVTMAGTYFISLVPRLLPAADRLGPVVGGFEGGKDLFRVWKT